MDPVEPLYHVPLLLRWLCYLGGMAVYMAAFYWFARAAFGHDNPFTMRQRVFMWLARLLAACAGLSLVFMIYSGRITTQPVLALPEISILLLLLALFLLGERRRFLGRAHIFRTRLPMEVLKICGVTFTCIAGFAVVAGLLQLLLLAGAPGGVAVFITGIIVMIPLGLVFRQARRKDRADEVTAYQLVWPLLVVCFFLMLPELLEYIGNSPEMRAFLQSGSRLEKA